MSCDERDTTSIADFISYPSLIVEVLSSKTEAFDRGDKFADYRTLPSLQDYVLISQRQVKVECFRRQAGESWMLYAYGDGDEVELASVNLTFPISSLYEDVPFS